MTTALCISITFLDRRYHGRGDGRSPEWPPSPMRLLQALVAGNGSAINTVCDVRSAVRWLETQPPPTILAPPIRHGTPCPLYVPNNAMDLVAKSWVRGNFENSIAEHRVLKLVCPLHLCGNDTVHYIWPLSSSDAEPPPIELLARTVEQIVALGWGIDMVVATCRVLSSSNFLGENLEKWDVVPDRATSILRCPIAGSLDALMERHAANLNRLADGIFRAVPPLTTYRAVGYRRSTDPVGRRTACFELRHVNGEFCRYTQRKLLHIAGMVRHLAKGAMLRSPPPKTESDWVERYIVGHRDQDGIGEHRQLSYLPLPSIGHKHADQAIRRVMLTAPLGDDAWLEYLAQCLAGKVLKPENRREFGELGPPTLVRTYHDKVARYYTAKANSWASVTPVILPGHDDRKPAKTRKLIEMALAQSGIDQPCTYKWASHSCFRNSLSAHKYRRDRNSDVRHWQFESVKDYLRGRTWVHLTLEFEDQLEVPGPLVIGAGRHCGFGLMSKNPNADNPCTSPTP